MHTTRVRDDKIKLLFPLGPVSHGSTLLLIQPDETTHYCLNTIGEISTGDVVEKRFHGFVLACDCTFCLRDLFDPDAKRSNESGHISRRGNPNAILSSKVFYFLSSPWRKYDLYQGIALAYRKCRVMNAPLGAGFGRWSFTTGC